MSLRTIALIVGGLIATTPAAFAQSDFWTTPTIPGYGKMHDLPDAHYRPDQAKTYKIVFGLTKGATAPDKPNPSLDHVARTVNLYVAAGVPLSNLKFVAVASGEATNIALDNEHYKAELGVDNPNLPLIKLLRDHGVDVAVCGQAVAEHKYEYAWIDTSVTLSLSALTTITTLEAEGYALMPM